ncbi:DUF4817 domain-containing protein [Trichonephila clavipes]|nr:DUF4817 domain-containing protein [Trichonephila clavipes]
MLCGDPVDIFLWENIYQSVGGVIGLSLVPQGCGFDPGPSHDAENRQQPCRMIIRHVKDPESVCFAWMLSEKLNPGSVNFSRHSLKLVPDLKEMFRAYQFGYIGIIFQSEANPQVYVETPLHPEKLTVWCTLWAGGIIGPYFKNDEGHNVTVNGDRYRAMITNFFIPELNNHDVQELRFQQDGATCHTARATIDLLKDTFGDRLISRLRPVNWPPRSCDLTPLDYFLWAYVKSLVYADKPQTPDHLEDNIRRVIADIRPQMLEKVIENWTSRLDYIRASRGSPMSEIIFKM